MMRQQQSTETDVDSSANSGGPDEAEQVELRFGSVAEFVDDLVLPHWRHRRDPESSRWCAIWWEHTEAISRLEALWESFEAFRMEPAGAMVVWFRDYLDPTMVALTAAGGAFHACDVARDGEVIHTVPPAWPQQPAPATLYDTQVSEGATSRRDENGNPARPPEPAARELTAVGAATTPTDGRQ